MTNETILKKAIEKAEKGGYPRMYFERMNAGEWEEYIEDEDYLKIIFDPDFGKAFFREGFVCRRCGINPCCEKGVCDNGESGYESIRAWKYHQHAMLDLTQEEKDPIPYLTTFL